VLGVVVVLTIVRVRPQALVLLLPSDVADAPGASSAPRATLKDVGRVAAGRPVVR
jgi:hypothetical protein